MKGFLCNCMQKKKMSNWYCKSDLYISFRSKVGQLCTTSYCSLKNKKQSSVFSLRFSFLLLTSDIGKVLYRQWKYRTCSGKNLWNTCNSLFSLVRLLLQFYSSLFFYFNVWNNDPQPDTTLVVGQHSPTVPPSLKDWTKSRKYSDFSIVFLRPPGTYVTQMFSL